MTERHLTGSARAAADYRFMVSRDMTLAAADHTMPELVFGGLRDQAALEPLREPLLAVAARAGSAVVGLALAELRPDGGADLRSLVVAPAHRRQGLGTALMAHAERALKAAGCTTVDCIYRGSWSAAPVVERIFQRRGWLPPQTRMVHYRTDAAQMLAAPWPGRALHRAGYRIAPWTELQPAERAALVERQARAPWYPPLLSPFQLEDRQEPAASVGLWHSGRVAGWLITHRLRPDTLQYTALFVAPPAQRYGGALALIRAVAERQLAAGIPFARFQVLADNRAMVRFADTQLRPMLTARAESRATRKHLTAA